MNTFDDIIIAVHGIGDQTRNATVRSVATRLARLPELAGDEILIAPQPLGYFHTDVRSARKVFPLDRIDNLQCPLTKIGFSEVFWADIPQGAVEERRTMEETKAWARTVVSRTRAAFHRTQRKLAPAQKLQLQEPDFTLAAEVLDEIIDTVYVLENLCFLAEKAGVLKFNLRQVLEEYLGDVQIVTQFTPFRQDIIGRFHRAVEEIHSNYPKAKLHIVAHSEGTVVSFLGLLHAMSCERLSPATEASAALLENVKKLPDWLKQVYGFMTIGSPIDKHILLWPELFEGFDLSQAEATLGKDRIKWRNYYDYGDPVGFELDTARLWLNEKCCSVFEFDGDKHDIGFARYLFPGKAHNDYWSDTAVFSHFIGEVVVQGEPPTSRPASRPLTSIVSPLLPYALSCVLLLLGTIVFYRAVSQFMNPPLDPVQSYVRLMTVGDFPKPGATGAELFLRGLGVATLVAGTTLLSRWPRLAKGARWWAYGGAAFFLGCMGYVGLVSEGARNAIGAVFQDGNQTWCTLASALVVSLIGMLAIVKPEEASVTLAGKTRLLSRVNRTAATVFNTTASRRQRWFSKGMRPLIVSGGVVVLALVVFQMLYPPKALDDGKREAISSKYFDWKTNEIARVSGAPLSVAEISNAVEEARARAEHVERIIEVRPPVWPVVLSGAVFLYLWWLAALVFDLAFVWHRYVRQSAVRRRLSEWRQIVRAPRGV